MTTRNSRALNRRTMVAAVGIVCGSMLTISGTASAGPGALAPTPERISGADRFGTAAAISLDQGGDDLTIVNGRNFPDGLASSIYGDNILLTDRDTLPAETLAELERIDGSGSGGIDQIKVVGGTSVVSSVVFEQLSAFAEGDISRVQGADRYATALAVATDNGNSGTIILATGENFPDALASGPLALEKDAPILLNNGTQVRPDVAAYLLANEVTDVIIVGGEAVVPASVKTQLEDSLGLGVTRLAGTDRAATAVAIANQLKVLGAYDTGVTAVNGSRFADALAAGPFAYKEDRPILLVGQNSIPAATANYHFGNCTTIANITAIGGDAVISDAVVTGAVNAATCSAPAISLATLVNNDFKQAVFTVNTGLTVTAKAGSAADGSAANAWQIAFIQNGTPGTEKVVVDATGTSNPTFAGIPTFVVTANLPMLTNAGFATIWNAGAGALTTAATTNPAGVTGLVGGSAVEPVVVAAGAILTTPGSQDSVVAVTFDRPVTAATPSGLYRNLNPATPPAVGAPTTSSAIPAAGTSVVTFTWNDVATVTPSLPNYQIRFATNSVTDAATLSKNLVPAAKTLTAP